MLLSSYNLVWAHGKFEPNTAGFHADPLELALIVFFVPETYHPVLLRNKAIRMRKETGNPAYWAPIERMSRSITKTVLWSCIRPFQLLFFEPMVGGVGSVCMIGGLISRVVSRSLYTLSSAVGNIVPVFRSVSSRIHEQSWIHACPSGVFFRPFEHSRIFNVSQGLAFLGLFVGMILGIISGEVIWTPVRNKLVARQKAQGGEAGGSEPEYRLPSTIAGAVVVPIALFGQSLPALTSIIFSNHDRQGLLGLHFRR